MQLAMVGFSLACSACDRLLFSGEITLEDGDNIRAKDILVTSTDVVCPGCNKHLINAEDDFTRDWKRFNLEGLIDE